MVNEVWGERLFCLLLESYRKHHLTVFFFVFVKVNLTHLNWHGE